MNADGLAEHFIRLTTRVDRMHNVVTGRNHPECREAQTIRVPQTTVIERGFVTHADEEAAIGFARTEARGRDRPLAVLQ